jgi:hypothetical protein
VGDVVVTIPDATLVLFVDSLITLGEEVLGAALGKELLGAALGEVAVGEAVRHIEV